MELSWATNSAIILITVTFGLVYAWRVLNWMWLKPKKMEKLLREQGLQGNPYRLLLGDAKDYFVMQKKVQSKPMNLSDDIAPRVAPYIHHAVETHGKKSFIWFGTKPWVILNEPEQIREVFNKISEFPKVQYKFMKLITRGLVKLEGEKWSKHRRIINPAFHMEKLKIMTPTFLKSCNDLISNWEETLSSNGSSEIDIWPSLQSLTSDVIARSSFGSSYEEGRKVFQLQIEQGELIMKNLMKSLIPLWRFLPTADHRKINENDKQIQTTIKNIINKREKAIKAGEATENDLLGLLLESNHREIKEHGNFKNMGLSLEEVVGECMLFHIAGQETTSDLLVWTMVLLSRHPDWQERARKEVLEIFGNEKPDFDGLNKLKIMGMILYEVLRLYPPITGVSRKVENDIKLGDLTLYAGMDVYLPIVLIHHDCELWGDDAKIFNPERFSGGISKATNGRFSYFPFGAGPRICIGQTFSLLEAKMAMALILQKFSFELSQTYAHAPSVVLTVQPQHGAHVILRKIKT